MNWFTKWLKKVDDEVVTTISEPIVEEVKVPLISEPVLSLIESLKNREWSFKLFPSTGFGTAYKCVHLGKVLKFTAYQGSRFERAEGSLQGNYIKYCECFEDWMTDAESKLVATTAFEIIEQECKEWKITNNWKEREKFMVLTKEKQ